MQARGLKHKEYSLEDTFDSSRLMQARGLKPLILLLAIS